MLLKPWISAKPFSFLKLSFGCFKAFSLVAFFSIQKATAFFRSQGDVGMTSQLMVIDNHCYINFIMSYPIGSMVLLYMGTWIPSMYPIYVSIYTSTMDPMAIVICHIHSWYPFIVTFVLRLSIREKNEKCSPDPRTLTRTTQLPSVKLTWNLGVFSLREVLATLWMTLDSLDQIIYCFLNIANAKYPTKHIFFWLLGTMSNKNNQTTKFFKNYHPRFPPAKVPTLHV